MTRKKNLQGRKPSPRLSLTALSRCRSMALLWPVSTYAKDRRSSRVFMRVRVVVAGKNNFRRRFREACETIVINAHGGLLYLGQELDMGTMVMVTNPFTQEEQEARVVYLGEQAEKGRRTGVEFLTPAPHFWGVEFTQPDWLSRAQQN